jgi:hypothetical protein
LHIRSRLPTRALLFHAATTLATPKGLAVTVRNAAELCEVGPTLNRPYDHKFVLDRIKRLLAARAQQGGR